MTHPQSIAHILNLEDALATRAAYQRYLLQARVPPVSFEMFALAYGKRKQEERTEEEMRVEYEAFKEEIARDLPAIEAECGGCPTYDEWKMERKYA